jgi:hypothetical protein
MTDQPPPRQQGVRAIGRPPFSGLQPSGTPPIWRQRAQESGRPWPRKRLPWWKSLGQAGALLNAQEACEKPREAERTLDSALTRTGYRHGIPFQTDAQVSGR